MHRPVEEVITAMLDGVLPSLDGVPTLFNLRTQRWSQHFAWDSGGTRIGGLSPTGRATVEALKLNNPYIVPARRLWVLAGWYPPKDGD